MLEQDWREADCKILLHGDLRKVIIFNRVRLNLFLQSSILLYYATCYEYETLYISYALTKMISSTVYYLIRFSFYPFITK